MPASATPQPHLLTRAALIESMALMIAADGVIADEELFAFSQAVAEHPIFADLSEESLRAEFRHALRALAAEGFDARLKALADHLSDHSSRLLAFALATTICFADADLAVQELELLKAFQRVFGLSEDHVAEIVEAVEARTDVKPILARLLPDTPEPSPPLSREEAFIEVMLLMAAADGEIQDIEVTHMGLTVANHLQFADLSNDAIGTALEAALQRILSFGAPRRLGELRLALPTAHDRIQAVQFALSVLIADGIADAGETTFLKALCEAFEVSVEDATTPPPANEDGGDDDA